MLAALVILLFMFGSFLAASLPLITAAFAVGTTFGFVALMSHFATIPDYTPPILVLVGLGVGIDYSLLVFARYRTEILGGADREQAARTALDTAGRSVLFAGATVVIALLGLYTLNLGSLEGVALSVSLTVLMTMVASLVLLPSLLTIFGAKLEKRIRKHAAKQKTEPGRRWRIWAGMVQRRPWAALIVAVAALGALCVPALTMQLGFADAGNDHPSTTSRQAYDLITDGFGPGANGPLVVVTQGSEAVAQNAFETLGRPTASPRRRRLRPLPTASCSPASRSRRPRPRTRRRATWSTGCGTTCPTAYSSAGRRPRSWTSPTRWAIASRCSSASWSGCRRCCCSWSSGRSRSRSRPRC